MSLPTSVVIIAVILFYLILPTVLYLTIKNERTRKITFSIFLAIYLCILFVCTIGRIDIAKDKTSIIFDFSGKWASKNINFLPYTTSLADFLINIAMLFPIGLATFALSKKKKGIKIALCLLFGFVTGLSIETYQFILPVARSIQLSDILLNSLSGLIGGIYLLIIQIIKEKIQKNRN